jgi:hypothetical protein
MPDRLVDALASAAARRMQSKSEYARQALLDPFKHDGIDLTAGDDGQRAA